MSEERLAAPLRDQAIAALPWPVLSVDVETNPADDNRIFLLGAVRSDDERATTLSTRRVSNKDIRQTLDGLAQGAQFLADHNLRRHDLPALQAQFAGLELLSLPVLDTLELSTIATSLKRTASSP